MDNFISEDDLLNFEGFLKYQAVVPATITPDELKFWQARFDEAMVRRKTQPEGWTDETSAAPR